MNERCSEYLRTARPFKFRDFFILAKGYMSASQFCEITGIKSKHTVWKYTSGGEDKIPSLLMVRRLALYTGVDAKELWLAVCNEVFETKTDCKLYYGDW